MKAPKSIDEYIQNEPLDIQKVLKKIRALVGKAAPESIEKIAWGMPTFYFEGNLVHFAAFKNHYSLFPGSEAIVHFKKDLKNYTTSKGTIQFLYEDPVPAALITKIVKHRLKENLFLAKLKAQAKTHRSKKKTKKMAKKSRKM